MFELKRDIGSITCDEAPMMMKMGRPCGTRQKLCFAQGVHLAVN